ncbi:MAG: hypothetical protein M1170_00095 [Patescibacteria group bacterium]|nr:hypothetical protein [Patescibacteria group bacterium]
MAGYEPHLSLQKEVRKKYEDKWVARFKKYQREVAFSGDSYSEVVDKIMKSELHYDNFEIFHIPEEME